MRRPQNGARSSRKDTPSASLFAPEHLLGLDGMDRDNVSNEQVRHSTWSQFYNLTKRYAKVKMWDVAGLAILLAQAPVLALFMYIVFPRPTPRSCSCSSCLPFGSGRRALFGS